MERPLQAYRGDEPYVFVCYAHEDSDAVYREITWLHEQGVNVWYDEGISPGHEWTQELANAIDGSTRFLYFVSPASVASRHCRNEVQYALDQDKSLVSVHLAPTELSGGLRLTLGSTQAILKYNLSAEDYQRKMAGAFSLDRSSIGSEVIHPPRRFATRRRIGIGFVAIALLATAGLWWAQRSEYPDEELGAAVLQNGTATTIAVLPFVNMSDDLEQGYFSDGISEDVLAALASQQRLVVRARGSSFHFRGQDTDPHRIADQLNVRYLVNGSVRAQGNRIRVTVRLTDIAANTDVWSNRYDRELIDVFAVQDEITESIVAELGAHFTGGKRPAASIEAYDAFLLGRYHYNQSALGSAEEYLLQAIELDPKYAGAHALLARVYETLMWLSPPNLNELGAKAEKHIDRAHQLDPEQPLARGLRAMSLPIQDAIDELDALVRQYPNDDGLLFFYSTRLRQVGRLDLELVLHNRTVALDPLSPARLQGRGAAHLFTGQLDLAREDLERTQDLGFPQPIFFLQIALLAGDLDSAKEQANRPPTDWSFAPPAWKPISTAFIPFAKGDRELVRIALAPLEASSEDLPLYQRCYLALLEGETEVALDLFQAALRRREPYAFYEIQGPFLTRTLFPEFYANARYQNILREYGLDEDSIAELVIPPLPF